MSRDAKIIKRQLADFTEVMAEAVRYSGPCFSTIIFLKAMDRHGEEPKEELKAAPWPETQYDLEISLSGLSTENNTSRVDATLIKLSEETEKLLLSVFDIKIVSKIGDGVLLNNLGVDNTISIKIIEPSLFSVRYLFNNT